MTKTITAILGLLLLVLGLSSLFLLRQDRSAAQSVDQTIPQGEGLQPGNCRNIIRDVSLSKRVMTEKESQTLRVVVANREGTGLCETAVRLSAIDFDLAPTATVRPVALEPNGDPVTLLWILKPKETGSFEILLTAGDQSRVLGIVVTNVLGFTAAQVQLLSYVSTFLGPMLTAPWWYERWEKRQKAKEEAEEKALKEAQDKQKQSNNGAQTFRPE